MIATLRLEAIGDAYTSLSRRPLSHVLKQLGRVPRAHAGALLTPGRRPWVARITGRDRQRRFEREFLRGLRDYREASNNGNRGVYLTFILRHGALYEVHELISWQRDRRYFCRVDAGRIVEMSSVEATAWLDGGTSALQRVIDQAVGV